MSTNDAVPVSRTMTLVHGAGDKFLPLRVSVRALIIHSEGEPLPRPKGLEEHLMRLLFPNP
jgi:hypothetical protein